MTHRWATSFYIWLPFSTRPSPGPGLSHPHPSRHDARKHTALLKPVQRPVGKHLAPKYLLTVLTKSVCITEEEGSFKANQG